jgi:hypothetical protein
MREAIKAGDWVGLDFFAPLDLGGTQFHVMLEDHEIVHRSLVLQVSQDANHWVDIFFFFLMLHTYSVLTSGNSSSSDLVSV